MPLNAEFVDVALAERDPNTDSTAGIVFRLRGSPDKAWRGFFAHLWDRAENAYPKRCKVTPVREVIMIFAPIDEIDALHLAAIKRVVSQANATYRGFIEREAEILAKGPPLDAGGQGPGFTRDL